MKTFEASDSSYGLTQGIFKDLHLKEPLARKRSHQ